MTAVLRASKADMQRWLKFKVDNAECAAGAFTGQINSFIMSVLIKVACLALYTVSHAFHKPHFSIFLEDYNENSFRILKHILVDGV